jgi:heme a synthase
METSQYHFHKSLRIWFHVLMAFIFLMIVIGGITRLTGSGLSIVHWKPVTGIFPPFHEADWQALFQAYQTSPEFQKINFWMGLGDFKKIFWWEFIHRILGRLIGLIFFVPLVIFALQKRIPQFMKKHLLIIGLLGFFQGFMGWYMVKSGLVKDPHVSAYRLVAHLSLALALMAYFFVLAHIKEPLKFTQFLFARISLSVLVLLTILAGGFVAGLKAGFIYNTFPLMGGDLIPYDYQTNASFWRNAFENPAAAQFHHRILATLCALWGLGLWLYASKQTYYPLFKRIFIILNSVILFQYTVGIVTLVHHVPVSLGTIHQTVGLLLWLVSIKFLFLAEQKKG